MSRRKVVLLVVLAVSLASASYFGIRVYRWGQVAYSAWSVGAPDTAGIRPWMTVEFVSRQASVPVERLAEKLGVEPTMAETTTLGAIARRTGRDRLMVVRDAQRAVAELRFAGEGGRPPPRRPE